ncbi:MAG: HD domain-containing phosphohydrolase [Thermodesulfobacteriota bacterium]
MTEKVLFVDDEQNVLDGIRRQLRRKFSIKTALSGSEALKIIRGEGPVAVLVADMRMPEMDGVQLLARVNEIAPDTVGMMLTGDADQQTAVEAINQGRIFRFLNKPCPLDLLVRAVNDALEQYRLKTAEKELLNKTLRGTVKVLTEILSLVGPEAFSRSYRIRNLVRKIAHNLLFKNIWEFEIAGLLSQIGCISLPAGILSKKHESRVLSDFEMKMYLRHPETGARLLENIPRFEIVAGIIRKQFQPYREFKTLSDRIDDTEKKIAVGAQILHLANDYDNLLFLGYSPEEACNELFFRPDEYNPRILSVLRELESGFKERIYKTINLKGLQTGMVANEDIIARNGVLLSARGQEISRTVMERLRNYGKTVGVIEPFEVVVYQQRDGEDSD